MIPFASQRALGQDLATHLMNSHDNENVEIAQVRGAVARDLHGAFAEWEAQAGALTRCRNYLYSLSVNPDPSHGRLTRQQYLAYIDLVEEQLGLSGQPRAVVFHVKEGREHCHVVWSRIDVEAGKARHLAYDHDKLMMATRLFAAEQGIRLPQGYYKEENPEQGKSGQLSLYEKAQQDETGLTREARAALLTALWRSSDGADAFVSALAQNGYILATGNRPFLLVDLYGHVNSLPKLIDDRQVRTRDVEEFLGKAYAPESLPSLEGAKALAEQHRKAIEAFDRARAEPNRLDALKERHAQRRADLEGQVAALKERQLAEPRELDARQTGERAALKVDYLALARRIRLERARNRPSGLAAFLGRVSGIALIRRKLQRYRDRQRYERYLGDKRELAARQQARWRELVWRHGMQGWELERQVRALSQLEQRELRSLETALLKERRVRARARPAPMPGLKLEFGPPAKAAEQVIPAPGRSRKAPRLAQELNKVARERLAGAFARAAEADRTEGEGSEDGDRGGGPGPASEEKVSREPRRKRRRKGEESTDRRQRREDGKGESDDGSDNDGPGSRRPSRQRQAATAAQSGSWHVSRLLVVLVVWRPRLQLRRLCRAGLYHAARDRTPAARGFRPIRVTIPGTGSGLRLRFTTEAG